MFKWRDERYVFMCIHVHSFVLQNLIIFHSFNIYRVLYIVQLSFLLMKAKYVVRYTRVLDQSSAASRKDRQLARARERSPLRCYRRYRPCDILAKARNIFNHKHTMNHQCLRVLPRAPPSASLALRHPLRPELTRLYATQTGPRPKRRNITVLSDDGRYEWGELSGREKVSRATQQSINFVVVLAGAVLTVWTITCPCARQLLWSLAMARRNFEQ